MTNIDTYITEKLHLKKDNDSLVSNELEAFIESFKGDLKDKIIRLMKMCIHELSKAKATDKCLTYIVKNENEHTEYDKYKWAYRNDKQFNVGDKTEAGSTILYVFRKGDKIPKRYL